jgi:hypothetical protein
MLDLLRDVPIHLNVTRAQHERDEPELSELSAETPTPFLPAPGKCDPVPRP